MSSIIASIYDPEAYVALVLGDVGSDVERAFLLAEKTMPDRHAARIAWVGRSPAGAKSKIGQKGHPSG
jgi:hypothetical protein